MSTLQKINKDNIEIVEKWFKKPCMVHTTATEANYKQHQSFAIEKYHVNELGWDHIGYSFIIEMDGTIYFSKKTMYKQYHCKNGKQNFESLGIAIVGNGDIQCATIEQLISLEEILKKYNITQIRYHCDFSNKRCPGLKLIKQLDTYQFTSNLIKRFKK